MNKKDYMKPAMRIVKMQQQHIICGSNPKAYDTLGGTGQYSRGSGGWFDEE